jgi:hypothetical protein
MNYEKLISTFKTHDQWLNIPKDVWKLIIKDFTIYQLRVLRVVCKYFASLIDGRFMNTIIYGIYRKGTWIQRDPEHCSWYPKHKNQCHLKTHYYYDKRYVRYFDDEIVKKKERCWFRFKIKESEKKEKQSIGNVLQISTSDNRRKEFKEWMPTEKGKNRRRSKFWKRNGNRRILDRVDCTMGCECEECKEEEKSWEYDPFDGYYITEVIY